MGDFLGPEEINGVCCKMTNIRMMDRGFTVIARVGRLSFKNVSTALSVLLYICSVHPHPAMSYLLSSSLPASVVFSGAIFCCN
jgi:hypothetical protein